MTTSLLIPIVAAVLVFLILGKFVKMAFRLVGTVVALVVVYYLVTSAFPSFNPKSLIPTYNSNSKAVTFKVGSYVITGRAGDKKLVVKDNGRVIKEIKLSVPIALENGKAVVTKEIIETVKQEIGK